MRVLSLAAILPILALALGAPVAPASPLACESDCVVPWTGLAFLPPVLVIESGASVTWSSSDPERHVNVEGPALLDQDPCFQTFFTPDSPGTARFVLGDGILLGANGDEGLAPCTTASFLPDGSATLAYHCVIHPTTMRAALVVVAAGA